MQKHSWTGESESSCSSLKKNDTTTCVVDVREAKTTKLTIGGATAKLAKNKFSLISIKVVWDIDTGLIWRFPKFQKISPERYVLAGSVVSVHLHVILSKVQYWIWLTFSKYNTYMLVPFWITDHSIEWHATLINQLGMRCKLVRWLIAMSWGEGLSCLAHLAR